MTTIASADKRTLRFKFAFSLSDPHYLTSAESGRLKKIKLPNSTSPGVLRMTVSVDIRLNAPTHQALHQAMINPIFG